MRIKVTGIIESDDLDPSDLDPEHETGLSDKAYTEFFTGERLLPVLEEMEFTRVVER